MEQAWSKKLCRQRVANCATHYGWCWQISSEKVRKIKGQLISKHFLGVVDFLQKTNKNKWHTSENEFIHLFFGRIVSLKKTLRPLFCLRNQGPPKHLILKSSVWIVPKCSDNWKILIMTSRDMTLLNSNYSPTFLRYSRIISLFVTSLLDLSMGWNNFWKCLLNSKTIHW